jgi:phage anti-repressor protein
MSIEKVNITIIEHKELKKAVSARELYEFLEVDTHFKDWIKRMVDYLELEINVDYIVSLKNEQNFILSGGRPSKEYFLTIDAAKEISMLQRSEKGKEARKYFIECERKLKEHQLAIPNFSNPYEAALAWAEAYKEKEIAQAERDYVIKTKAWIGEKREATAMATASVAVRKVNKLENELGVGRDFNQVRAIWWLKDEFHVNMPGFWSQFGKKLKEFCVYNGYEIKVIPDSKYGKLYNYPVEASDKFRVRLYNNPEILGKFRKYS